VGDDKGPTDGRAAGTAQQARERVGPAAADRAPSPPGFAAARRQPVALLNTANDIKHFLVTHGVSLHETAVVEFGTDYDVAQYAYQQAERWT
jgi:hypothetical protein